MRLKGASFGKIAKELSVSKSTAHSWVGAIKRSASAKQLDRQKWIKEIQPLGAKGSHLRRQEVLKRISNRVDQEIKLITLGVSTQKGLLSMLYWAEGSKGIRSGVVFANTDPYLISLFITLLRNCYPIIENKLRGRVHIHDYHDEEKVKSFWSKLTSIPGSQFNKSHIKNRSKNKTFRRNLAGICYVKYNSVHLKEEILIHGRGITEKLINKTSLVNQLKRL